MKRMLLFLALAFAMSATWTSVHAQSGGVVISKFSGTVVQGKKVQLAWWATEDRSLVEQVVEHATNRLNFQPIGTVPAIFTGEGGHLYSFLHSTPGTGLNFYRLRLIYDTGLITYSNPIRVNVGGYPISIRPRPLVGADEEDWNEAIITDIYGRPIMRMSAGQTELDLERLPTGIYILNARYSDGWQTSKFVVNKN